MWAHECVARISVQALPRSLDRGSRGSVTSPLDGCDPRCRKVSLDFDKELYEVVVRGTSTKIAELLGTADWLAVVDVDGNDKKVCVLDRCDALLVLADLVARKATTKKPISTPMRLCFRPTGYGPYKVSALYFVKVLCCFCAVFGLFAYVLFQKLTESKEEAAREEAAREEAARAAAMVEHVLIDVVSCRNRKKQVEWLVEWEGGKQAWGAAYRTWEPLKTTQVLDLVGGVEELVGRPIQVLFRLANLICVAGTVLEQELVSRNHRGPSRGKVRGLLRGQGGSIRGSGSSPWTKALEIHLIKPIQLSRSYI